MSTQLVRDVMTEYVVAVRPDAPFRDIVAALARYRISAVPVIDSDRRVLGVVSECDLLYKVEFSGGEDVRLLDGPRRRAAKEKAAGETARELMTVPPVTIGSTATLAEAARVMDTRRVKRLPVVEGGRLVGIVARSDVLRVYLRPDHEVERDIDEQVLQRVLALADDDIAVRVAAGVATLSGSTDRRSTAEIAVRLTGRVPGVVRVVNHVRWDVDDTAEARLRYPTG
jgi:CBS domain-containing protein